MERTLGARTDIINDEVFRYILQNY
jgi:hypothetical protein